MHWEVYSFSEKQMIVLISKIWEDSGKNIVVLEVLKNSLGLVLKYNCQL